jgi:hypothetical protein
MENMMKKVANIKDKVFDQMVEAVMTQISEKDKNQRE